MIAGCESGRNARPAEEEWFRSVAYQCAGSKTMLISSLPGGIFFSSENEVPFFLKQMEVNGKLVKLPELDGVVCDQLPGGAA